MKIILRAACVLLVLGWASSAQAQISSSAHDFSEATWNTTGDICSPCHIPHNAPGNVTDAPLWSRDASAATYTMYSGATGTVDSSPNAESALCLGCHDGTVALNAFSGNGTVTDAFVTSANDVGIDLGDDHPVSVAYTGDGTNGYLAAGSLVDVVLYNSKVECASCHEVHNENNNTSLLRSDNTASALCLKCHIK